MKVKILLITLVTLTLGCNRNTTQEEYYTESDFGTVRKIDLHCHINTDMTTFMEQAVADNFRILTINTDFAGYPSIQDQEKYALTQTANFPNNLAYFATFSMVGWDDEDWSDRAINQIKESIVRGAIGVKVWKNIGMVEKDKDGNFIMIDNPKLDPVIDYLVENKIPLTGHLGEPLNCWLPLEEMTVIGDKSYFTDYPEYHMYLHPEYPSYEDQIEARNNMLDKHPGLLFIGAHLGSMEWSVDMMAEHLDKYPHLKFDLAARIAHVAVQSQEDMEKVRNFFIKYQDRIMYGTDKGDFENSTYEPAAFKQELHEVWIRDWKFFTSDDTIAIPDLDEPVKGLKLPREVVDKIYFKNAEELFPVFKNM